MESISLIIPISGTDVPTDADIASYRRVLRGPGACLFSRGHPCRAFPGCGALAPGERLILIPTAGTGKIAALREGMDAASNQLFVVLDSAPSLYAAGDRRGDRRPLDFGRRFRDCGSAPGSVPFQVAVLAALLGIDWPVDPGNFGRVLGVDRHSTLAIAGGPQISTTLAARGLSSTCWLGLPRLS